MWFGSYANVLFGPVTNSNILASDVNTLKTGVRSIRTLKLT